jgi:deoxyribonucleoside regulator
VDSDSLEHLAQVAELYYDHGLTQAAIADRLGYSRSMISRLLTAAREQGVVEVRIHHPLARQTDLEQQLRHAFGLQETRVLARGNLEYPDLLRRLGVLAARLVEELVDDHMTLGVSWGTALAEMVGALRWQPRSVYVVQMIGSLGASAPEIDGPELARRLARNFGGRYATLPAPLIVDSEVTRENLCDERRIQRVLDDAADASLALVGIGTVDPNLSSLVRAGYLEPGQLEELVAAGAVGDVCAIHFDQDGRLIHTPLTRRVVGIDSDHLSRIPRRLGIAGGQAKAPAILGALHSGLINILVTDDAVAATLLRAASGDAVHPVL